MYNWTPLIQTPELEPSLYNGHMSLEPNDSFNFGVLLRNDFRHVEYVVCVHIYASTYIIILYLSYYNGGSPILSSHYSNEPCEEFTADSLLRPAPFVG